MIPHLFNLPCRDWLHAVERSFCALTENFVPPPPTIMHRNSAWLLIKSARLGPTAKLLECFMTQQVQSKPNKAVWEIFFLQNWLWWNYLNNYIMYRSYKTYDEEIVLRLPAKSASTEGRFFTVASSWTSTSFTRKSFTKHCDFLSS